MRNLPHALRRLGSMAVAISALTLATAQGTPTITVTMLPGVLQDLYTPFVDQFEEDTGITVKFALLPFDELRSKVLTDLVAGTAAYDVVLVSEAWIPEFAGFLRPLEPYIENAGTDWDYADFIPASLAGGTYQEQQIGIPWRDAARILFWNKHLFDEAGLQGPPETWDALVAAAQALTVPASGDQPATWGYAIQGAAGWQGAIEFATMLYSWGGSILNEDNTEAAFNGPEGVAALQFYTDLVHEYGVAPPASVNWSWDQIIAGLQQGTIAMTVAYAPYAGLLDDPSSSNVVGQMEFAPSPQAQTSATVGAAWQLSIPKSSDRPDEAWTFIEYFTSKAVQLEQTRIGNLPVRASVFEDPELNAERRDFAASKVALQQSVRLPALTRTTEIMDILGRAVNEALTQQKSAQQALDDAAAAANAVLADR